MTLFSVYADSQSVYDWFHHWWFFQPTGDTYYISNPTYNHRYLRAAPQVSICSFDVCQCKPGLLSWRWHPSSVVLLNVSPRKLSSEFIHILWNGTYHPIQFSYFIYFFLNILLAIAMVKRASIMYFICGLHMGVTSALLTTGVLFVISTKWVQQETSTTHTFKLLFVSVIWPWVVESRL